MRQKDTTQPDIDTTLNNACGSVCGLFFDFQQSEQERQLAVSSTVCANDGIAIGHMAATELQIVDLSAGGTRRRNPPLFMVRTSNAQLVRGL